MLVLTRKIGETVVIRDDIHVTVVAIRGDKVRLGFTAPGEIPVHREEVLRRISEDRDPRAAAWQEPATSAAGLENAL